PPDAAMLNSAEIEGLNWTVAFGGGSYLTTSASLIDYLTVELKEVMVVTRENISVTPDSVESVLSGYKNFEIDYVRQHSRETTTLETPLERATSASSEADDPSCDFPGCVSWDFTTSASPNFPDFPNFVIPVHEICTPGPTPKCVTTGFS